MKQIFFFTSILFLSCIQLGAQTTDVVTGLYFPRAMALDGNILYIAESGANKISKIDITATTPTTTTDVVTGLTEPSGLALDGNILYIAEYSGNKISKIDLTATTPTATDVITGLSEPKGLAIDGNDLYFVQNLNDGSSISKIDITETTPTAIEVLTATGSAFFSDIVIDGNYLYGDRREDGAIYGETTIFKMDITETTPTATDLVTELFPSGLVIKGNDLYFAQGDYNSSQFHQISKIDITASTPTVSVVETIESNYYSQVIIDGDHMYVSMDVDLEYWDNQKIVKFDLPTLSIDDDFAMNHSIKFYPNPTNDFIQVSGLIKGEKFVVYDVLGAEVFNGVLSADGKIDLRKLTDGTYFLKMNNHGAIKFIKE